jgi:hypothetical protein
MAAPRIAIVANTGDHLTGLWMNEREGQPAGGALPVSIKNKRFGLTQPIPADLKDPDRSRLETSRETATSPEL